MFKQKHEKIDFNYLTWHNLLRVYEKYKNEDNDSSFISTTRDSIESSSFKMNLNEEINRESFLTVVNDDRR
jgi:hypothetical protein